MSNEGSRRRSTLALTVTWAPASANAVQLTITDSRGRQAVLREWKVPQRGLTVAQADDVRAALDDETQTLLLGTLGYQMVLADDPET